MTRRASSAVLLLALALPGAAVAADEVVGVLAVGEPPGPTPELAAATEQLRAALAGSMPGVVGAAELRQRMTGPPPPATFAELKRAHAGAVAAYTAGEFESSVKTLRAVAEALEALPESADVFAPWTETSCSGWRARSRSSDDVSRRRRTSSGSCAPHGREAGRPLVSGQLPRARGGLPRAPPRCRDAPPRGRGGPGRAGVRGRPRGRGGPSRGLAPTGKLPRRRRAGRGAHPRHRGRPLAGRPLRRAQSPLRGRDAARGGARPRGRRRRAPPPRRHRGRAPRARPGRGDVARARRRRDAAVATAYEVRGGKAEREGRIRMEGRSLPPGAIWALAAFVATGRASALVSTPAGPSLALHVDPRRRSSRRRRRADRPRRVRRCSRGPRRAGTGTSWRRSSRVPWRPSESTARTTTRDARRRATRSRAT